MLDASGCGPMDASDSGSVEVSECGLFEASDSGVIGVSDCKPADGADGVTTASGTSDDGAGVEGNWAGVTSATITRG